MKLVLVMIFLMPLSGYSLDIIKECHTLFDELDRDYCHAKKIRKMKKTFATDRIKWKKSLTQEKKTKLKVYFNRTVDQIEAHIKMLETELASLKIQQEALNKAETVDQKNNK